MNVAAAQVLQDILTNGESPISGTAFKKFWHELRCSLTREELVTLLAVIALQHGRAE
jgi:hypothetical protein